MAEMRQNKAKLKLKRKEPVIAIASSNADEIDTLGSLGTVDLIWVEMEHGPASYSDLSDLSRACDLWGMTSLVRVNTNAPWLVGRALDRGMQSVLVPHVNTKEEADIGIAYFRRPVPVIVYSRTWNKSSVHKDPNLDLV